MKKEFTNSGSTKAKENGRARGITDANGERVDLESTSASTNADSSALVNITINIGEYHIHMQELTDIHNFYPDGFGGLSEDASEQSEKSETVEQDEIPPKAEEDAIPENRNSETVEQGAKPEQGEKPENASDPENAPTPVSDEVEEAVREIAAAFIGALLKGATG